MWYELEGLLTLIEKPIAPNGEASLTIEQTQRLGYLYRAASSDLVRVRAAELDAATIDYLNTLVGNAYSVIYSRRPKARANRIIRFVTHGFPRLVRAEWRPIALSAALLFGGAGVGAIGMVLDPNAATALVPEQHLLTTPTERVESEKGTALSADAGAAFATQLFTHNIRVSFLIFAAGILFGVGSGALLIANGVPLGALAVQYFAAGQGTFFVAWILPHGIPELTEIVIVGGASFVLARGIVMPGRLPRPEALRNEALRAVLIAAGGMPILVVAGLIEGTISQIHDPVIPSWLKLTFAGLMGVALYAYLLLAGRSADVDTTRDDELEGEIES